VIAFAAPGDEQLRSPLGRTSPLLKLGLAVVWLLGLVLTLDPRPPIILTILAVAAGLGLGRIPARRLAVGLLPLWSVALSIGVFNALFSGTNVDPTLPELARLGPFRVTEQAALNGIGVALRVVTIAAVGVVFALTTDSTRLVDALVQQGRLPERFGYGALAAYQAIPRLAEALTTLQQARRIRGLRTSWHPTILVGLLVLAIRHGDRLALAMDARAFGAGPRSRYREVRWTTLDLVVATAGVSALVVALALGAD
jgi:energy-coupling factor transporter transmembrane protein EcfT